jgi:hypothetical protein
MVGMDDIRRAVYAGSFYPGDEEDLFRMMEDLFNEAGDGSSTRDRKPKALILPHAGYIYSGAVAARGYREVMGRKYSKTILIGPYHFNPMKGHYFRGPGPASYSKLETPLGNIEYDRETAAKLASSLGVDYQNGAHAVEHSLEVQLLMGECELTDTTNVAQELANLIKEGDFLILISTDLSHFYPYDRARELDEKTLGFIEKGQAGELYEWDKSMGGMLCGVDGVITMMQLANLQGWPNPVRLTYSTSGDRGGGKREVVGYASLAYYSGGVK